MPNVEQTIHIKFPCGYEIKTETKVKWWIGEIDMSENKVELTVCPIHGTKCNKRIE